MIKITIRPLILLVSLLIFSCGKEDPQDENITLSQTAIEIDYEETFRLDATFIRDGYSPSGFTWESDNPNIAAVRNDGTVTGQRVGTTLVTVYTPDRLFSAVCEVTVNPTNFLYLEPLFDFGQNRAYIRANETRTFLDENETSLLFRGENENIFGVIYAFDETLYEASVALLNLETEDEVINLIAFLEQRYELLGFDGEFLIFENEDILLGVSEDEDGYFVVYLQNDDASGTGSRIDKLQKISRNKLMINRQR
ncbi:MAG TPA: Ig-like domain-containing protein [Anditalea sp.]|nr:Ig-like domain-containing protein [Anditalea sp.]